MKKSISMAGVVAAASVAGALGFNDVATAHGTGVVSGGGVFAVCSPTSPSPATCTPYTTIGDDS